jgi:hypothetical protein
MTTTSEQNAEDHIFAVEVANESGGTDTHPMKTATEVLDFIIDGDYAGLDDEQALAARIIFTGAMVPTIQSAIIDAELGSGQEIDGEIVDLLMDQDESTIAGIEWPEEAPPKIVVTTDFGGDTGLAAPTGNVVSIDPEDELTLVRQLGQFGLIRLFEKTDEATATTD